MDCVLTFYDSLCLWAFPLSNAGICQLFLTYSEIYSEKLIIEVFMICFGLTFRMHFFP